MKAWAVSSSLRYTIKRCEGKESMNQETGNLGVIYIAKIQNIYKYFCDKNQFKIQILMLKNGCISHKNMLLLSLW